MKSKLSLVFILNLLNDVHSQILNGSLFTNYQIYGWTNNMIYCDDYIDCTLNCYQSYACYFMSIFGPKNAVLTINCHSGFNTAKTNGISQYSPCYYMNVYAEDSSELYINVYNERSAFGNVVIYAPTNPAVSTFILCGITNADSEYKNSAPRTYPASGVCSTNNVIYSKYGFDTVEWTYYENNTWATTQWVPTSVDRFNRLPTMYCGDLYQYSCSPLVTDSDGFVNCELNSICGTISNSSIFATTESFPLDSITSTDSGDGSIFPSSTEIESSAALISSTDTESMEFPISTMMTGSTMQSLSCYQTESMLVTDADIIECSVDENACSFRVKSGQNYWRRGCTYLSSCGDSEGCEIFEEEDSSTGEIYNVTSCCCVDDNCNEYESLASQGSNMTFTPNDPSSTDVIIGTEDMEGTYDDPSSTDVIINTEADDANEYRNFMVIVIISIIMIVSV